MRKVLLLVWVLLVSSSAFAADLEQGKKSYAVRCASCHGDLGLADGAVGKAMPPGTVTNLVIGPFKYATDIAKTKELITKGGGALKLNAMMPPAPSIEEQELSSLAEFVMSLRKK